MSQVYESELALNNALFDQMMKYGSWLATEGKYQERSVTPASPRAKHPEHQGDSRGEVRNNCCRSAGVWQLSLQDSEGVLRLPDHNRPGALIFGLPNERRNVHSSEVPC